MARMIGCCASLVATQSIETVADAARVPGLRFSWRDLPEQVEAFAQRWPDARADRRGFAFVTPGGDARLRVPLAAVPPLPGESVVSYAARSGGELGQQAIVLLRAGAVALGCWDGEQLRAHKSLRKYVVRGRGKAQPTHLKTRGKSRYGSRLRLQNWRSLLAETSERLGEWWSVFGVPQRVFWSAPVRAWSDLFAAEPSPPFVRDDRSLCKLPVHVHRPDFAELQRVRNWLLHGRLELPAPA
jgi:hypothetical protein